MKNKIVLSIIVPCYNSELYLPEFLKCISRQLNPKVEIILINDGSFDKTGEIILVIKSKIPELLSIPIATNSPINVGKIFKLISIPSVAPFKNTSKTFTFSSKALKIMLNITKGIAIIEI